MTPLPEPLTPRQRQVLDFLKAYRLARGFVPSLAEVDAALGLGGPAGAHHHLRALEKKGYVRRGPKKAARAVTILEESP